MRHFWEYKVPLNLPQIIFIISVIAAASWYGYYRYDLLQKDFTYGKKNAEETIKSLEGRLASTTAEKEDILVLLKARAADFQNEIDFIKEKVSTMEKLQNTDPELLQKYSKVYFLNENYIPAELSLINEDFLFNKTKPLQIHTKVRPYLEALMRAARADSVDISALSAYRSFDTQASLKSQYTVTYGTNSNKFSADQGYSEHQLGTTVDFTTKKTGEALVGFDKTPAHEWLLNNAYRFGFILSYPKENSYYIFEPWHWRFVGVYFAAYIHDNGKSFYDLPQRDIDQYLISIFN